MAIKLTFYNSDKTKKNQLLAYRLEALSPITDCWGFHEHSNKLSFRGEKQKVA